MSYDYLYKVMLLGDGGVGKTATLMRFVNNLFQENYKMTIGADFSIKDLVVSVDGVEKRVKLQIWDIGGQERFESVRPFYYKGTSGAIIVFDLTRYDTFKPGILKWIDEMGKHVKKIPLIILGNKNDLREVREVDQEEALKFARDASYEYYETSAKTGENIGEAFRTLAYKMVKRGYNLEITQQIKSEDIQTEFKITPEMKELINKKVEIILTSNPISEEGFRFLIMGNEPQQKPFLSQLLRAERLVWPPDDLSILYHIMHYKLKIERKEYHFQIYLLTNLFKLSEKEDLFLEACKQSHGLIIFYDPENQDEFSYTKKTCIKLRQMFPDLEIILTAGKESGSKRYQELDELEKNHEINTNDDIETLLPTTLINTLKRQKKLNKKKEYLTKELQKMQETILTQLSNPEIVLNQMKQFIQSIESSGHYGIKTSGLNITIPEISANLKGTEGIDEEFVGKNLVFFSYSTTDSNLLQIPKIAKMLEKYHKIDKVVYWEEDCGINIVEYMSKYLEKCKVLILFCTENAKKSKSVKAEWEAAFQLMQNEKIQIIPVFQNPDYIPSLLLPLIRIYFDPKNIEKFVSDLSNEIVKKL